MPRHGGSLLVQEGGRVYDYHNSEERQRRLRSGRDRCASTGTAYDLEALVHEGRIRDPENPLQHLTTVGVFIYAVNESGSVRLAPDGDRDVDNSVKHESLFHNATVLAAGEIAVIDGLVAELNDRSGSYGTWGELGTNPKFARVLAEAFGSLLTYELFEHLLGGAAG